MPYMEQLLLTVERPRGQRLMTASMVCDRKASPDELAESPVLSYRHIPSAETAERPSVSELVRLDVTGALRKSADGSPELYAGRAALTLASTAADSWHQLAPVRHPGRLLRRRRLRPELRPRGARLPRGPHGLGLGTALRADGAACLFELEHRQHPAEADVLADHHHEFEGLGLREVLT